MLMNRHSLVQHESHGLVYAHVELSWDHKWNAYKNEPHTYSDTNNDA